MVSAREVGLAEALVPRLREDDGKAARCRSHKVKSGSRPIFTCIISYYIYSKNMVCGW